MMKPRRHPPISDEERAAIARDFWEGQGQAHRRRGIRGDLPEDDESTNVHPLSVLGVVTEGGRCTVCGVQSEDVNSEPLEWDEGGDHIVTRFVFVVLPCGHSFTLGAGDATARPSE